MLEHRQDESLWAAAWLHRATNEQLYLDVLGQAGQRGGARTEFSCNDKCLGAQLLVAKVQSSWYSILTTRRQFFFSFFCEPTAMFSSTAGAGRKSGERGIMGAVQI